MYWPDDKKWYTGVVLNSFNGWLKIKRKRSAWTEHVQVLYDLDGKTTHSPMQLTNNNSIRLTGSLARMRIRKVIHQQIPSRKGEFTSLTGPSDLLSREPSACRVARNV